MIIQQTNHKGKSKTQVNNHNQKALENNNPK